MELMEMFKLIIIVQLFFSFAITGLAYAIPDDALNYVTSFSNPADEITFEGVTEEVQDSLEQQTNIPVIDLGALVFYSGNILIDLLLNFVFAIPQMLGLLVHGLMLLLNVDTYLIGLVQGFASAVVLALYVIGIMQLLTSIRSGRVV